MCSFESLHNIFNHPFIFSSSHFCACSITVHVQMVILATSSNNDKKHVKTSEAWTDTSIHPWSQPPPYHSLIPNENIVSEDV